MIKQKIIKKLFFYKIFKIFIFLIKINNFTCMVDTKCIYPAVLEKNSLNFPNITTSKNFKEDSHRNLILNKSSELFDLKSEISDSRRIDLDEDSEIFYEYQN